MSVALTQLDNGIVVASDSMSGVESVSLGAWISVGARHEPEELNGIAHVLEHMAFKGTARRSARDIAEEIEAVGGHLNAYTGRESTAYYAQVLREHTGLAVDLIADILVHPRFDSSELEREKAVILQEIGQAQDTPDDIIFDHFQEIAYPRQAFGRPILGQPETVKALSSDSLRDYMQSRYDPRRLIFAAAGAIEHERLVELVAEAFAELTPGESLTSDAPVYSAGDLRQVRALEQAHLILGLEAIGYRDPDYYAASIFATLFGGGMSSRLFQEVREERGLAYSVFSFLSGYSDTGLFGVYAGTGELEAQEVVPLICGLLTDAGEDVREAEIDRARNQIKASILMGRERTSNRCEHLANQLLTYGRALSVEEIVARLDAVDRAAIGRVTERFLASTPTLIALGPVGNLPSHSDLQGRLTAANGRATLVAG